MQLNIQYNKVKQNLTTTMKILQNLIENPKEYCENDCVPTMDMYEIHVEKCYDNVLELKILLKYAESTPQVESLSLLIISIIRLIQYLNDNKSSWFNSKVYTYSTSGEEIMTEKYELWLDVINTLENYQGHPTDLKKNIEGFTVFM